MKTEIKDFAIIFGFAVLIGATMSLTLFALGSIAPHQAAQTAVLGSGVPGGPTGDGGGTHFTNIPSNTSVTCGSSTVAAATSTSRSYATLVNDSANTIYLSEGVPATTSPSAGIRLNANGGSYEINALNLYTGALYCASVSSSTLDEILNQ